MCPRFGSCINSYSSLYAPFLKPLQNNNKRLPWATQATLSPLHESCCDKLCRWLSTAIRQHTVSLTKCFLSDTLELLWLLAAWFQVFICALLGGCATISVGFCHHCDPATEDTWHVTADGAAAAGLQIHCAGAMLDLSGGPRCSPPSIRQRLFCVMLAFADMFHLETDVNVKEVQMEISAF